MPREIYTVELDGREYDIEGDRPPTEQEVRALLGHAVPNTSSSSSETQSVARTSLADTARAGMGDASARISSEFLGQIPGAIGRSVVGAVRAPYDILDVISDSVGGNADEDRAKARGILEGFTSLPRKMWQGDPGAWADAAGAAATPAVMKGATAAVRGVPRTLTRAGAGLERAGEAMTASSSDPITRIGRTLTRHGLAQMTGQAVAPGLAGVVVGEGLAMGTPPILKGAGRVMQRTGRAMGFDPLLDEALRSMPVTTPTAPRLVGKGGQVLPPPPSATQTWGDVSPTAPQTPPSASQAPRPATTGTGSIVPPTPRPDLVAVGDEAAFNAARPQPMRPAPALSVDEVVAQRFNAVEPQREIARAERLATSHAPSAPAIEPLPPSRSSGPRSPVAPELTPRDLEVLGIDPATGKNPQGMRILKLKGITPDAKQRILQSRANRRGQYQADAEILADLRRMQEREP